MNSFGTYFRISIYGASHEKEIGVIIDGCPAGIAIQESDFTHMLNRRRPLLPGTTSRIENDIPEIRNGVYQGFTTGAPIHIVFTNHDICSEDYDFGGFYRPGHADFTAATKYHGNNDSRGGGMFSGRMTVALVAAGVVAMKLLAGVSISSSLISAGGTNDIESAIALAIKQNDSIGGVVNCIVKGIPIGWGEPFFNSVESLLSHLLFSIPGVKAISFGNGIESADMMGSECNDKFIDEKGTTATNHSGGIHGGITNGNNLIYNIYCKPTSSISKSQYTFNFVKKEMGDLVVQGRHDVCFALRVPVIVEAVTAIVLADLKLWHSKNL